MWKWQPFKGIDVEAPLEFKNPKLKPVDIDKPRLTLLNMIAMS